MHITLRNGAKRDDFKEQSENDASEKGKAKKQKFHFLKQSSSA
jgi:hypothetical protein